VTIKIVSNAWFDRAFVPSRFLRNDPLTVGGDRIGLKDGLSLRISQRTEAGFDGLARVDGSVARQVDGISIAP
jgi:hypothetical protein